MRRKSSLFVASVTVALLLVDVMAGEGTRRPFQSTKAPKGIIIYDLTIQVHGLATDTVY